MTKQPKSMLAGFLESFFRKHLVAQRGASPATVNCYRDALRLFLTFASHHAKKRPRQLHVGELDREMVLGFLDHLEHGRGNSVRTRNCRLAAIHSFFHHIASRDPAVMNLASMVLGIQGKRTTKPVLGYIRQPDLETILAAPDRSKPLGRRYHPLLLFLARTGARLGSHRRQRGRSHFGVAFASIVAWEACQAAHRASRERYSGSAACLPRRTTSRLPATGAPLRERTGSAPLALWSHLHSSSSGIHHNRANRGNPVH
jgi:hypothetical protein